METLPDPISLLGCYHLTSRFEVYQLSLLLSQLLKNAIGFHGEKWKLVNHLLFIREVYLIKREVSRLPEEEVRKYFEGTLDTKVRSLPQSIIGRVNRLKQLSVQKRGEIRREEIPKDVIITAFPLYKRN